MLFKTLGALALLGLLLLCLVILFTPTLNLFLNQNPGSFDRERFEAIVRQVRDMPLEAGSTYRLRLDNLLDADSLRLFQPNEKFPRGMGAGNVWVEIMVNGVLKVVIETKDLGHAGEYGFAYSDIPLSLQPLDEVWFTINVPGHINLVLPDMKIDDHWWEVLNNLD